MADNPLQVCIECGTGTRAGFLCVKCQTGGELRTEKKNEQADVIKWLAERRIAHIRIANEMARKRGRESSPGTADLFIMSGPDTLIGGVGRGVFVEMKQAKGGKQSDAQKEFAKKCERTGYLYLLCKGADDAIKQLTLLGY